LCQAGWRLTIAAAKIATGRQLRHLRRRNDPCGIDRQRHEFERRVLLGEGVEPFVPAATPMKAAPAAPASAISMQPLQ